MPHPGHWISAASANLAFYTIPYQTSEVEEKIVLLWMDSSLTVPSLLPEMS